MVREIEADGYITREADISPIKRTCYNCLHYRYDSKVKGYSCSGGHQVQSADWRMKYSVCDKWECRG